jgi:hypothetical protein
MMDNPGLEGVNPGMEGVNPGIEGVDPGMEGVDPGMEGEDPGMEGVNPSQRGHTDDEHVPDVTQCDMITEKKQQSLETSMDTSTQPDEEKPALREIDIGTSAPILDLQQPLAPDTTVIQSV